MAIRAPDGANKLSLGESEKGESILSLYKYFYFPYLWMAMGDTQLTLNPLHPLAGLLSHNSHAEHILRMVGLTQNPNIIRIRFTFTS